MQVSTSSSGMGVNEKNYEKVVEKILIMYQFDTQDTENLIQFRELIRNVITLYDKQQSMDETGICEQ